jgi:hypothetical protein
MKISKCFERCEYPISFFIIFVSVFFANLYAVFGLEVLLLDDNARFYLYKNNLYTINGPRAFIGLSLTLKTIPIYLFSNHSVEVARLYVLTFYMVPLSLLFYHFNRKYLQLPVWVCLISSILVNIVPSQHTMPAFLDGSYHVPGMIAFLASLIYTSRYLNHDSFVKGNFVIACLLWLLVCDLMAEMGIFLYPVLLFFIYSSGAPLKRQLSIYIGSFTITALRIASYFQTVGLNPTNKPSSLTTEEIIRRITQSIQWWVPFETTKSTSLLVALLLIAMTICLLLLAKKKRIKRSVDLTRPISFYSLLFVSASLPFWLVSPFFSVRYFYIPYFGLTTIAIILLHDFAVLTKQNKQPIAVAAAIALFATYSIQRHHYNKDLFSTANDKKELIFDTLKKENILSRTNIALVNFNAGTGGFHFWSSGYLQYLYQKPGVRGAIGPEYNFYDPFNLKQCGYDHRMSCLDLSKDLIAYKWQGDISRRMEFFLQWMNPKKRESEWHLYTYEDENVLKILKSGRGLTAYIKTLSALEIDPENVLWGNSNNANATEGLN